MAIGKNNIPLTLIYKCDSYPLLTYTNEYYSLMTLISDHLAIMGFGLCSGMGSCGTCMVKISSKYSPIIKHVLACEIRINDELSNTEITIADLRY